MSLTWTYARLAISASCKYKCAGTMNFLYIAATDVFNSFLTLESRMMLIGATDRVNFRYAEKPMSEAHCIHVATWRLEFMAHPFMHQRKCFPKTLLVECANEEQREPRVHNDNWRKWVFNCYNVLEEFHLFFIKISFQLSNTLANEVSDSTFVRNIPGGTHVPLRRSSCTVGFSQK